jgi:hypothetical protein
MEAVVVWVVVRAQPAVHARDLRAVVRAVVVMGGADAEVVRAAVVKAAVARVVVKVVVVRAVVVRAVVGAQSAVYGRGLADAGPSAPEAPATHYARPGPLWRLSQTRAR